MEPAVVKLIEFVGRRRQFVGADVRPRALIFQLIRVVWKSIKRFTSYGRSESHARSWFQVIGHVDSWHIASTRLAWFSICFPKKIQIKNKKNDELYLIFKLKYLRDTVHAEHRPFFDRNRQNNWLVALRNWYWIGNHPDNVTKGVAV